MITDAMIKALHEELRSRLISDIVDVITTHQLLDYGHRCAFCKVELYGEGHGMTLSRHRAEKIVDLLLSKYFPVD